MRRLLTTLRSSNISGWKSANTKTSLRLCTTESSAVSSNIIPEDNKSPSSTGQKLLPHNKGNWKLVEDQMLRDAVSKSRDALGHIKWREVEVLMKGVRSYSQCLDRWTKQLRFQDEHGSSGVSTGDLSASSLSSSTEKGTTHFHFNFWTDEEDNTLTQVVPQCEYVTKKGKKKVNWSKVMEHFNGTRSYMQCYMRWFLIINRQNQCKRGRWDVSEDKKLLEALSQDPPLPTNLSDTWTKVSNLVGSRTSRQCKTRWRFLKNRETQNNGRWSAVEDVALKSAIAKYYEEHRDSRGVNWKDLCENLTISRSPEQCRTRAGYYESISNTEPWSEAEDSKLKALVKEFGTVGTYGGIHWEAVGKHMRDRGSSQCRTRWFEHVKLDGCRKKGPFSPEEDEMLTESYRSIVNAAKVEAIPQSQFWIRVGEHFGPTRSKTQCRLRWNTLSVKASKNLKKEK